MMNEDIEIQSGAVTSPVPGLLFANPDTWARTLLSLRGNLVEIFLEDGQSTLGHLVGFQDNPEDEEELDLVLSSGWEDGPTGPPIAIAFDDIGLVQIL